MILDRIEQAGRYAKLNPGFAAAFAYLRRADLAQVPAGRYEIDGDRVYALVQYPQGRSPASALMEAHRNYIDIQYVVEGVDTMGWRPTPTCAGIEMPYDAAQDAGTFSDEPEAWVAVQEGSFAVFFPEDAHMPNIAEGKLHKVVVKVKCED